MRIDKVFKPLAVVLTGIAVLGFAVMMLTAAATDPGTLQLVKNDQLGSFIADGKGMSLYMYTKDVRGTSNCYGGCATNWPPLLSTGGVLPTVKEGLSASLLGTTQRTDGTTQVTYNGWPLYYWIKDAKAGDVTGQAVGKVWWVVSAEGNVIRPAGIKVAPSDKYGSFITDDQGLSLYMFTKDAANTSNCAGPCAQAWPPLVSLGKATVGDGLDSAKVGTVTRKDGTVQVTYAGWPLYYWVKDLKPGDILGQNVNKVWFVLAPNGDVISTAP